jgi:sphingomyelin phosphodiesterase 2
MLPVWMAVAVGLVTVLLAAAGNTTVGRRFRADRSAVGEAHPQELLARELARQRSQRQWAVPPAPTELRVVTLNTGLIAVTPLMAERLEILLASDLLRKYDIVALQEVTLAGDAARIVARARELGLGFAHAFDGGVGIPFWPGLAGTGLLVLSRWPIQETVYRRYVVNGKPEHLHHYDYYGAKGTGLCKISLGDTTLNLYVTHMHAAYNDNYADKGAGVMDEYEQHRSAQSLQMSEFIRTTSHGADLTLAVGDFNSLPSSLAMRTLRSLGRLQDAWAETHPAANLRSADTSPTTKAQMEKLDPESFATFGAPSNSFHDPDKVFPTRIDYVLYHSKPSTAASRQWMLRSCEIRRECGTTPSGETTSLSDHEAMEAMFSLRVMREPPDVAASMPLPSNDLYSELRQTLAEGQAEAVQRSNRHSWVAWSLVAFCSMGSFLSASGITRTASLGFDGLVLFGSGWVCAVFMVWSIAACVDKQSLIELGEQVSVMQDAAH